VARQPEREGGISESLKKGGKKGLLDYDDQAKLWKEPMRIKGKVAAAQIPGEQGGLAICTNKKDARER